MIGSLPLDVAAPCAVPAPPDDLLSSWTYELPESCIAQEPAARRDASRMLVLRRDAPDAEPAHARVSEIGDFLRPGDLLVLNDTRVIPARLRGRKEGSGGALELLLVRPLADGAWAALVRPSAKVRPGALLRLAGGGRSGEGGASPPLVRVEGTVEQELRIVRIAGGGAGGGAGDGADFVALAERYGELPLPPYIARPTGPVAADRDRYQTVFAREPGAVAAPTAGLHFTRELLADLAARGIAHATLTLHVGPGTFAPLRGPRLSDQRMHAESFRIPAATAAAVAACEARGGRLVAVGTTACRALESWQRLGRPGDGAWRETRLFLRPADPPRLPLSLLTNFHLPETTLLALVGAFLGRERTLSLYALARDAGYRFYSYGDAMLLL